MLGRFQIQNQSSNWYCSQWKLRPYLDPGVVKHRGRQFALTCPHVIGRQHEAVLPQDRLVRLARMGVFLKRAFRAARCVLDLVTELRVHNRKANLGAHEIVEYVTCWRQPLGLNF